MKFPIKNYMLYQLLPNTPSLNWPPITKSAKPKQLDDKGVLCVVMPYSIVVGCVFEDLAAVIFSMTFPLHVTTQETMSCRALASNSPSIHQMTEEKICLTYFAIRDN